MSKVTNLIFKNATHYVTSGFGNRKVMNTKGGYTSSFHNGTDYGTNSVKLPQYAIENGIVLSCGTDKLGGKFVWIKYPRINVKMLHYHLSSVNCKINQVVSKGTLLGYTGMSGKATGIHLHLSIVDLTTGKYLNPETFLYNEYIKQDNSNNDFFDGRLCFKRGDTHQNIGKICFFFAEYFYGYFYSSKKDAHDVLDGNLFGPYLEKWVIEFQKRAKDDGRYDDEIDGKFGPKTLKALVSYGFIF
ncbi:MAG: peptidoglycan DD-metalloendopeptidase family protein [Candidatus Aphodocola sp.]